MAGYTGGLTYVLRQNEYHYPFIDPLVEESFSGDLNQLNLSRRYSAVQISIGLRYFLQAQDFSKKK
jgi:hypothetical protein